jgi:cyclopropane fatty-acyl-phospholipid synthase-like methyltransferase
MSIVEQARAYERDYHENLYGSHELFEPGTWMYKPAAYAVRSFDLVPMRNDVQVLDLGGGVGRHSIPAAKYFGVGSKVLCVDLLDSAIEKLRLNAEEHGVKDNIVGIVSDVENYSPTDELFDLVLSISCIEHVPTKPRLEKLVKRLQAATAKEGIHCFMMITNNEWLDPTNNEELTPLIEQNLTSDETIEMLERLYEKWKIHDLSTKDWQATQLMNGRNVVLKSTCVQFTAQNSR